MIDIIRALDDDAIFGSQFRDKPSWQAWRVFLCSLFGLPMGHGSLETFKLCTGRSAPSSAGHTEAWLCCGRRSGKSYILALIAVFLAAFRDWRPYLARGERATVMIIAADRRQARVILRFIKGLLEVPMLAQTVEREGLESIDLVNRVTIEVHTSSFRSVRGYSIVAALCDEMAVWPTDDAADPDYEVLAALRPGMITIPGSMLLCASSPYARRGALFDAHHKHYGKDGDEVLVWQASTRMMNPTVRQSEIDKEIAKDPARATAEYGATFRTDFEAFITREAVEACISLGVRERAYVDGEKYFGAIDPSGGSGDSMTLAIAHRCGDVAVLDLIREAKPPFSPESIVTEFVADLKRYHIAQVTSDRYAAEWPREQFRKRGVEVKLTDMSKSELYLDLLPVLNSRRCDLLDNDAILGQLVALERRTARTGRDTIDHAPHSHDDIANVVAGVVHLTLKQPRPEMSIGLGGKVFNSSGMVVSDSITPILDRFKPPPPPPTANDVAHRENLRRQHEEMRDRIEGPSRPPLELSPEAKGRLAVFKRELDAKRSSPISSLGLYGKCFGVGR
jgi:terminase large subunit-like protein